MNPEDVPWVQGPEVSISESRSKVTVMVPTAHRLVTSPEFEVHAIVDSAADHEWSPPFEAVSEILHAIPAGVTRLSIRFDRRG